MLECLVSKLYKRISKTKEQREMSVNYNIRRVPNTFYCGLKIKALLFDYVYLIIDLTIFLFIKSGRNKIGGRRLDTNSLGFVALEKGV